MQKLSGKERATRKRSTKPHQERFVGRLETNVCQGANMLGGTIDKVDDVVANLDCENCVGSVEHNCEACSNRFKERKARKWDASFRLPTRVKYYN